MSSGLSYRWCRDAPPFETRNAQSGAPVEPEKVNILGVNVSAINVMMALATIDQWVRQHQHDYVCVTDVHGVIESQSDPRLREIQNLAAFVTPDSTPLAWVLR